MARALVLFTCFLAVSSCQQQVLSFAHGAEHHHQHSTPSTKGTTQSSNKNNHDNFSGVNDDILERLNRHKRLVAGDGPAHPTSLFASILVDGDCSVRVKYTHDVPNPPPHAWHKIPSELTEGPDAVLGVSTKKSLNSGQGLSELEGFVPLHEVSDSSAELDQHKFLVVVRPSHRTGGEGRGNTPSSPSSPTTPTLGHMFADPRYKHLHGFHGGNSDDMANMTQPSEPVEEVHYKAEREIEHVWFPGDAHSFDLYCHNVSHKITLPLVHETIPTNQRSAFTTQSGTTSSAADGVEVIEEHISGPPESQLNIIFLAGGFRAEEKADFLANVSTLNTLMQDPALNPEFSKPDESDNMANMHRSVPFNRYWPFFNVYAVWQPSQESGASRPLLGLTVRNNLGCTHPDKIERAVYCDRDLSLALADTTPARPMLRPDRSLIINIVNTPIYGGSGLYIKGKIHIGNFFNQYDMNILSQKEKMLSLMDHEIGHSYGDLADEYSIGSSEFSGRKLRNCQAGGNSGAPTTPQWQHWIDIARADPTGWQKKWGNGLTAAVTTPGTSTQTGGAEWSILPVPEAVCGFTNYYKPASQCMLHRLNNFFMCPVCREQSTLSIMENNFQLSWPRKPLEDTITVIPLTTTGFSSGSNETNTVNVNTSLVLHLPAILTEANHFTVKFFDHNGTQLPLDPKRECPVCVKLTKEHFENYPVGEVIEITATVQDSTVFLTSKYKDTVTNQLNQNTTFKIMVVNSVDNITVGGNVTLEGGNLTNVVGIHESDKLSRFTLCPTNGGANGTDPLCAMKFTSKKYEAPTDVGALLDDIELWVYVVMGALALLFLLLWLYAAGRYKKNEAGVVRPIFKTEFSCFIKFVRFIMMFSAIIFMIASLGVMGIGVYYYTETSALGKIIIFAAIGLSTGLYLMAFIGYWSVSSRSKRMLIINGMVLFLGMALIVAAYILITYVGEDMKKEDGFWTKKLQDFWRTTVDTYPDRACAIQGMLKCSGFNNSCASVVGSSQDCPINCQVTNERYFVPCRNMIRKYIWDNYTTITQILGTCAGLLVMGIVLNFVYFCGLLSAKRAIRARHAKAVKAAKAKNKQSQVQDRHKALYILKSLGDQDTRALVREFKRMDIDGSGSLNKKEMFLFLKGAMCYKATRDEIDCIFELADSSGDGVISLDEFLAIFGRAVPRDVANPRGRGYTQRARQRKGAAPTPTGGPAGVPGRGGSNVADVRRRMREKHAETGLYDEADDLALSGNHGGGGAAPPVGGGGDAGGGAMAIMILAVPEKPEPQPPAYPGGNNGSPPSYGGALAGAGRQGVAPPARGNHHQNYGKTDEELEDLL